MADVLKAQRLLVKEKDLGDRFLRIANRLEELQMSGPDSADVIRLQKEIEALRPLLRLSIRSEEFRSLLFSALRIAKHVIEGQAEGDLEDVLATGEKHGVEAGAEKAKEVASQTMDNVANKLENEESLMSDKDWEKLSEELDSLFRNFQSHSRFREAVPHLFNLASSINTATRPIKARGGMHTAEEIQSEARDLIAQFSGTEQLDSLIDSVYYLTQKIENNPEAQTWWGSFKEQTLSSSSNYKGKQDIEKFRVLFRKSVPIFSKFKNEINEVLGNMNDVVTNMANDKLVERLRESLATLQDDLFWKDQDGNRYFDADAAGVLTQSVTDVIKNQFKYLALPKVTKIEDDTRFSLDNLVISATLPDKIDFHLESLMSLNTANISVPGRPAMQSEIYLTVTVRGITVKAPQIHFTYDSSTLSDSGIMSVSIPPPGANMAIDFVLRPMSHPALSAANVPTSATVTAGTNKEGFIGSVGGGFMRYEFVRIKSHFAISDMDIQFDTDTLSHNILIPFMTSLFKSSIIDRFESGIEESLDNGLVQLGHTITGILNQAPNPLSISSFTSMVSAV